MWRTWPAILMLVALVPVTSGCVDLLGIGGDGGTPRLLSSDPAPGDAQVSVLTGLTLRFSTPVRPSSVGEAIRLWDGRRPVALVVTKVQKGKVQVAATDPLDFGTDYQVLVSPSLLSREGKGLSEPESFGFRTEGLPAPVLDQDSLFKTVEAFAHDTMRGRWSGSPDELKAAHFLQDRFLAYGLEEAPGGMIQSFQGFARRLDKIISSQNVLAVVPGSGSLAQEWVVVGAHYDHIGFRDLDNESQGPNNGADDNGSGTMLILEMARVFRAYAEEGGMGARERRSVLFAAFGAEEEGLLGSCSYVHENPAVPLAQTRAMMNFDMVGRLRDDLAYISGGETSEVWDDLVGNANAAELTLVQSEASCTGCTDHACFWQAGIPFVGFFTGLHDEYHRPGDDVDLINFPGMGRMGDLSIRILSRLTVMSEPPPLSEVFPS